MPLQQSQSDRTPSPISIHFREEHDVTITVITDPKQEPITITSETTHNVHHTPGECLTVFTMTAQKPGQREVTFEIKDSDGVIIRTVRKIYTFF